MDVLGKRYENNRMNKLMGKSIFANYYSNSDEI